ncbi:MAG: hypothetical protein FWG66_08555 [Spirochaetes bacterium]|nr:hypothetical protein [Spirochaetota bacterium]
MEKKKCQCFFIVCSRHGNCKACEEYHKKSGSLTACEKKAKKAAKKAEKNRQEGAL